MDHCMWRTLHGIEGFANDMLSGLSQYLDRYIFRDHVAFDQCTDKIVLCIGRGRESHFDLFKADIY